MSWIRRQSRWDLATAILLAVVTACIALTFQDYGVTVDERHSADNGKLFFNWYASGFADSTINTEGNQYLYGSFANALSEIASRVLPFGPFESSHLLFAITGVLGICFAWGTGKLLGGPMAGFLAAAILTLTPAYYGHMFVNPKDIPFAVLFLVTIYCLLRVYDLLPTLPGRSVALLGLVIGLTLGIRIGAVMLFGYCVVLVLFWIVARHLESPSASLRETVKALKPALLSLLKVGVISWGVMIVWWPYAQLSPLLNPLRAFRRAANFTDFPATVLFDGKFIPANALPWDYLPTSFLITLPEFYAIALAGGLAALITMMLQRRRGNAAVDADRAAKLLFLIFAILFPLMTAIIMRPILYDANRHFLFVIPPLAVLAGVSLAFLLTSAVARPLKAGFAMAVIAVALYVVNDMRQLHPYQYIFYNRSFGGLPAALGRYETDYWGQSHKEGMDWLIANYETDAARGSIRVANTAVNFMTSYYVEQAGPGASRFVPVGKRESPDVILSITRWNAHLNRQGRVLHTVGRMGTPLLYVVELRRPATDD